MTGLPTVILELEGHRFEIFGLLVGRGPVWSLIKQDAVKMNHGSFTALAPATQRQLAEAVQQYLDDLNRSRPPERVASATTSQIRFTDLRILLDQTERDLRTVLPLVRAAWQAKGIGHNRPPEPIDPPPITVAEVENGIKEINVYRTEIRKSVPSSETIDHCKKTLARIKERMLAFGEWLSTQSDAFIEKIQQDAGCMLAEGLIRAAGTAVVGMAVTSIGYLLTH